MRNNKKSYCVLDWGILQICPTYTQNQNFYLYAYPLAYLLNT